MKAEFRELLEPLTPRLDPAPSVQWTIAQEALRHRPDTPAAFALYTAYPGYIEDSFTRPDVEGEEDQAYIVFTTHDDRSKIMMEIPSTKVHPTTNGELQTYGGEEAILYINNEPDDDSGDGNPDMILLREPPEAMIELPEDLEGLFYHHLMIARSDNRLKQYLENNYPMYSYDPT